MPGTCSPKPNGRGADRSDLLAATAEPAPVIAELGEEVETVAVSGASDDRFQWKRSRFPVQATIGSSGSGRGFRWKRRSVPVEAAAVSSASDDRFQWKRPQFPVQATIGSSGNGPVSTGSDDRLQWKRSQNPVGSAVASSRSDLEEHILPAAGASRAGMKCRNTPRADS